MPKIGPLIYLATTLVFGLTTLWPTPAVSSEGFSWPVGCIPGISCTGWQFRIGYPDVDRAGRSSKCGPPGYLGHMGTDIVVSSVDQGVSVLAAADGIVRWIEDGKFDRCPNAEQKDCDDSLRSMIPLGAQGTSLGFNAGNFVVVEHTGADGRYLTFYAHLRRGSLNVVPGQPVTRGQKIALVASSGNSQVPHLHFGVYRQNGSVYKPVDPWKGPCNLAMPDGLWETEPPYQKNYAHQAPAGASPLR